MGGKIDVYIDVVSLYSYIAFDYILKNQDLLAEHGVQIDIHPVLLGGINAASGNKPPWTLPAKASYGAYDARRASARAGKPDIVLLPDLMDRAMTVWPLRALHFIKHNYPSSAYLTAWHWLFHCLWEAPNLRISKPEVLAEALANAPSQYPPQTHAEGGGGSRLFSEANVKKIMEGAATQGAKDAVKARTQEAIERGAFGAPWFWAVNDQGRGEPFFGSDRFYSLYEFLGVPFQDIAILPPGGQGKAAKL